MIPVCGRHGQAAAHQHDIGKVRGDVLSLCIQDPEAASHDIFARSDFRLTALCGCAHLKSLRKSLRSHAVGLCERCAVIGLFRGGGRERHRIIIPCNFKRSRDLLDLIVCFSRRPPVDRTDVLRGSGNRPAPAHGDADPVRVHKLHAVRGAVCRSPAGRASLCWQNLAENRDQLAVHHTADRRPRAEERRAIVLF